MIKVVDVPSLTQLRIYTIRHGLLDEWLAHWRARVVPARREHGVRVGAAWLDRERSQFLWVTSYEADENVQAQEYGEEGLGHYVISREIRVVEEEDDRFRGSTSVRHSARALVLDGDELLLWRRIVPGRPLYWVTPGGGVEPEDADLEAALRRELREELGATVGEALECFAIRQEETRLTRVSHFFLCRLAAMDLADQTGPEFADPARGRHEPDRVPFTAEGLASIRLEPPELAEYLMANVTAVRRLAALLSAG